MKFYIDVMAQRNVGVPPYVSLGFLVRAVHSYLTESTHPRVFLAFPKAVYGEGANPGNKVRIFAAQREDLEGVLKYLANDRRFQDILVPERIKPVPQDVTQFERTSRVRMPSRAKQEHYDGQKKRLLQRRMEIISKMKHLPAVPMQSKSSSSAYHFSFERLIQAMSSDQAEKANEGGKMDGYGLSHSTAPIWLPHLP